MHTLELPIPIVSPGRAATARTLIDRLRQLTIAGGLATALALAVPGVNAADGVWNVDAAGAWTTLDRWLANTPADGADAVAYFTNNITADRSISLGATARTIGHLVFSDGFLTNGWTFARVSSQPSFTLSASTTPTITVSNLTAGKLANIRFLISGTQGFTKEGNGVLMLGGSSSYNNNYSGLTTINAGALTASTSSSGDIMIPGDLVINSGGSWTNITVDNIADSATVTVNAGGTFAQGVSSSKSETIANLILNGGAVHENSTSTLTVTNSVDARSGTVQAFASSGGKLDAGTFTKSTSGTVTLQTKGSAATTGGLTSTIVNDGTLILDYSPQDASKLLNGGTLTVNGGTLIFTNGAHSESVGSVILAGGVMTNAGGTASLVVSSPGNYDVRSGSSFVRLGGSGGLIKSTAGEVALGANNPFSGDTRLVAGSLTLLNVDALASSTLDADPTDTGTFGCADASIYKLGGLKGSRNLSLLQTNGGGAQIRVGLNNQTTTYSGNLGPASSSTLEKLGNGTLYLHGTNSVGVLVQAGGVGGNGTFTASFDVVGGRLTPGTSVGRVDLFSLTVASGGTVAMEIDKTAGTNDYINCSSSVIYGGTLAITNLSAALAVSDSFKLFNAANYSGVFATIIPATPDVGLAWDTNSLAVDGTLKIVAGSVGQPTLNYSSGGGMLNFNWTGTFKLQAQTNSLSTGLVTNNAAWFDYPSGGSSPVNAPVDPAAPTVFFRLSSP